MPVDGTRFEAFGQHPLVFHDLLSGDPLDFGQGGHLLFLQPAFEAQQIQPVILDAVLRILFQVKLGGELQNQAVHGGPASGVVIRFGPCGREGAEKVSGIISPYHFSRPMPSR
jgi:hypothetical protein